MNSDSAMNLVADRLRDSSSVLFPLKIEGEAAELTFHEIQPSL